MNKRILYEMPEKREQCVKHFRMADKSMVAAVYPSPVHYKENEEWKTIDNRLEEVEKEGKKVYQNHASAVKVSFAETVGEGNLVTVEKEGMKLAWNLERPVEEVSTQNVDADAGTQDVSEAAAELRTKNRRFRVVSKDETDNSSETQATDTSDNEKSASPEEKDFREKTKVQNWSSEGVYDEILPGVDLQYVIQGERIKENIHLNTREAAQQPLVFHFTHPGMVMRKEADGGLGLYRADEADKADAESVYKLVKPYMYDAKDQYCGNVELEAECMEGCSKVTVVPDAAWLKSEEREYPVVIDPSTETAKTKANIEDTYIFSGGTSTADMSTAYAAGSFVVGWSSALGKLRALLRFKNLPDIGKGSIIYAAKMYIWQYEYSSNGTTSIPLKAYEVKNSWTESTAKWSNQPQIDENVLDYTTVAQVLNGNTISVTPIGFDVTRLVRQWYNTGNNYGIMVRSEYEDTTVSANKAYARFYSSDHPTMSSDQYPSGMFYYRNVSGLENYQSYHEQPAGRAGCGYTNDFTGNLVWIHPDAETTGGPLQASVKHVYNSSEVSGDYNRLGCGWRFSCQQELKASGITAYPYVYTDEDGTKHYFYKDSEDGDKIKDEDGLGLVITLTNGTEALAAMVMETKDKVKYRFGSDGYLRSVEDLDGNKIVYTYVENNGKNHLKYVDDSTGQRLELIYANDATWSRVNCVKDTAGRQIWYGYDTNGDLVKVYYPHVDYPNGKTTSFTYDSDHKLLSVTNPDGYSVNYTYTKDFNVPRVSRITEKGSDSAIGQELLISYENGNTTIFEEPGLDGELSVAGDNKKSTYHFDNMGRPTDILDSDGFANNYAYYTSGMKNNKLSKEGSVQKTVYGLLKNHCFSRDGEWYTYRISDGQKGTVERTTGEGYSGLNSAKMTKTSTTSQEGICQDITLTAGTYTLSAYVKTENLVKVSDQKGAGLMILRASGSKIYGDRFIDYTTDEEIDEGWERLSLTFQITAKEKVTVFAGMSGMTGTFYVSGVQLEEGNVANKLNLLENAGFEECTDEVPDNWTFSANVTGAKNAEDSEKGICASLEGDRSKKLYIAQTPVISGEEGAVYHLSCWAKGVGIPEKEFGIYAKVNYADGTAENHTFDGNPNISDWQFIGGSFRVGDENDKEKKKYTSIKVHIKWHNQYNQALFDGFQLVKDDGESFQYDDEGNLVSAVSAAESSNFAYDKKGSITRMGNVDGTEFDYGYDSKNHLTRSANSEGVRYLFEYDAKGQPTAMRAEGGTHLGAVTPGRVYYIREKLSANYLTVKNSATADGTAILLNSFTGANAQKWKVVECRAGYVQLEPQHASGVRLDLKDGSDTDGATIQLLASADTDAQKWKLLPKQDGSYQIANKGTSDKRGLSNAAQSTASGQAVVNSTLADENKYQNWYFEPADEGNVSAEPADGKIVAIRVRKSGMYISVKDSSKTEGASVVQKYYTGGKNQQFRLISAGSGYYYLEPLHAPGMVLKGNISTLVLSNKTEGEKIQQFFFSPVESGKGTGYKLVNGKTVACVACASDAYKEGEEIQFVSIGADEKIDEWWILEECSERIESSMTYTESGRHVASVTDARGNMVQYTYDNNDRLLTSVTDAKGSKTSYTYDTYADHLTAVKKMVDSKEVKVQYTYDKDRLTAIIHNGFSYKFAYDNYGNRKSVSVGDTPLIQTTYRNKNGLTDRVTYATGESIRNAYNSQEQLESQYLVKADGTEEKLYTNTYDNYGNIVKQEDHRNSIVTECQFDMIGRAVGVDSSDGLRLRNQYDDKNRVAAVVQKLDDTLVKTEYLYGEVEKQQKPGMLYGLKVNGTERASYTYDQLARQNKKVVQLDNGTYETSYSFLPGAKAGTTTTLLSSIKNGNNVLSYTYDELGNIETISENGVLKCTYHYDELSRLIREDNVWENKTICYEYDNGGNLTEWNEYTYTEGVLTTGTTLLKENSYEYGNTVWKDQLTAYKGEAITYDNQGNPLTYIDMVMSWEKGRELKKIVWGDLVLTYTYDAAGRRIAKTELGVTTKYYWDGDKIIGLKQGNDRMQFVYDEKDNLFSMRLNGATYYYLFNGQNDVLGLIDSAGNQVVSYIYNSWGKLLSVTDTSGKSVGSKNPFKYRGYCYDEETGFYYVSSRYYDPEVGRFINADTTDVLTASTTALTDKNLYAYCDNNPVMRKDTGGAFWETAIDVVSLCVSAAEVMANPTDPWAWAGLAGDAIDLIPFVTGVGEMTKVAKVTVKAVDNSDDVIKATRRLYNSSGASSGVRKLNGSYNINFASGTTYTGKGGLYRSTVSASSKAKKYNDRVTSIS